MIKPKPKRDEPIQIGDVVHLKSGSPRMTVTKIDLATMSVECCWFRWEGRGYDADSCKLGYFPYASLAKREE